MSHEVETMFYCGDTPWHGLGIALENPPTIHDAIIKAGLDWTVSTHPLYYKMDSVKQNTLLEVTQLAETPNCAVVRDSDQQYLGTVGKRWTPLQNSDAFEFFQPFLDSKELLLETAGSLRKGKHVWILAALNKDSIKIAGEDRVREYLLLSNGHDGKNCAVPALTPVRVVCANTLAAAEESQATQKLRVVHSKQVKENLELVRETISLVHNEFLASAELYRELAKRQISARDLRRYVKKVFLPAHENKKIEELEQQIDDTEDEGILEKLERDYNEIGAGERVLNSVTRLFEDGRGSDIPEIRGTWWAGYNAIAEYLSYERGKCNDIRLDSLWFGQNRLTNDRALQVARKLGLK
jgi:phage/plasmid-like protein (TIGR03299 family)